METKNPEIDLSIVIPTHKEAHKIAQDIQAAVEFMETNQLIGEILVVDDGSPDGTVATAQQLEAKFPQLKVFSYAQNRGKGYALRYGIFHSQGRRVMFADAGLCVPYEVARLGLTMLDMNMCDMAHGSRRMKGSVRRRQPLYRRVGSKLYSIIVHTLMGVPLYISDTQCGFKIYQGEVARHLYGLAFTDGFMIDIEIILRALALGYQILEFPVLWSNDADTRFNPVWGSVKNLKELWAIRWRLSFNKAQRHDGLPPALAK